MLMKNITNYLFEKLRIKSSDVDIKFSRLREIKEAFVDWTNPDSYTDENIVEKLNTADGLKTFVKDNIDIFIDYADLTDDEFNWIMANNGQFVNELIDDIIRVNGLK